MIALAELQARARIRILGRPGLRITASFLPQLAALPPAPAVGPASLLIGKAPLRDQRQSWPVSNRTHIGIISPLSPVHHFLLSAPQLSPQYKYHAWQAELSWFAKTTAGQSWACSQTV